MNSKPDAPAPEPEKVEQADVTEARERARSTRKSRGIMGRSASLLSGGFGGYGSNDKLG